MEEDFDLFLVEGFFNFVLDHFLILVSLPIFFGLSG